SVQCHMWTYLVGPQWAKRMMMTGDPIDGKTAERIGLILKAVPPDKLEGEVSTLAGRMANIPLELLMPHKSLINKVMDLMGHRIAQQMSADAVIMTHYSDSNHRFRELSEKEGLRAALLKRDGPFGDYTARPKEKKS
ncbi:MAG: enoyl-CoA hydratase-related protein, partial [Dehalococcoidia bacterium]